MSKSSKAQSGAGASGSVNGADLIAGAFRSLRPYLTAVALVSLVVNVLVLTGPLFMLQVYDRVLASGSVPTLVVISSLVLVLYLFYGLLEGLRGRILGRIGQGLEAQLTDAAFRLNARLPMRLGGKASEFRPVQDLDTLRQFMSGGGPAAIFDLPWMPLYMGLVFLFHPLLGLIALGGALIICVLIVSNEFLSRKPEKDVNQLNSQRLQRIDISQKNGEALQAMGMEESFSLRWQSLQNDYWQTLRRAMDRSGFFGTSIKTIRFIMQSAILGGGAWLAIDGEISPGVMIAASIMTSRAVAPIEQAVTQWRGFVAARQATGRLKQILTALTLSEPDTELPLPKSSVVLSQVTCAVAGERQPFVTNISLSLTAGDGLGVIGPSGSGKSTLARAIVGVLPAMRGSIRLDGAEIDQWSLTRRGDFVGYLPQDLQLFDGTVAENISRFRQGAPSDKVIEAARMVDMHDFIVGLPQGYDTRIGGGGMALSGGQKQRMALARAVYGKPFLVVLDEPNSNLDAEGEEAMGKAVESLRRNGSVVIVIAHRPSALGAMNKVLCMRAGQSVAFGPRDEVLRKVLMPVPTAAGARK